MNDLIKTTKWLCEDGALALPYRLLPSLIPNKLTNKQTNTKTEYWTADLVNQYVP